MTSRKKRPAPSRARQPETHGHVREISDKQPPLTEEDIRRGKELSEKYGWEQLRNKR